MRREINEGAIGSFAIFLFELFLKMMDLHDPFLAGVMGTIGIGLGGIALWESLKTPRSLAEAINRLGVLRQEGNAITEMCLDSTSQDTEIQRQFDAWVQRIRDFLRNISIGAAMETRLADQQNVQFLVFGSAVRQQCYNLTVLYRENIGVFIREMSSGTWAGTIL